ncbi:MAG TPA: hypothetical protein VFZ03_08455 [Dongiaceae bacterium]
MLGMHRSGTSCVAELLLAMGAYFRSSGMPIGNAENPHGLFERMDLHGVCHLILQQMRAEWWAPSRLSSERLPARLRPPVEDMLTPMLADLNAHEPWFIKEPRLCLLLPMLRARFGRFVAVCVWRDPLEVAESLRTRDAIGMELGIALWEHYVRSSFAIGVPRVMVSYNRLLADPAGVTGRLLDDLTALGIAGLHMPSARQLAKVVDPALSRSRPHESLAIALTASQHRLLSALQSGDQADPELALPIGPEGMAKLAQLEDARREQMILAAHRSLADARRNNAAIDIRSRIRLWMGALRYLPLNPSRWASWLRRGTLGRRLGEHFEAFAIAAGGGFDSAWYASHYTDVAGAAADPLMHFVRFGAPEGRDPAPRCSTKQHLHALLEAGEKIKSPAPS